MQDLSNMRFYTRADITGFELLQVLGCSWAVLNRETLTQRKT